MKKLLFLLAGFFVILSATSFADAECSQYEYTVGGFDGSCIEIERTTEQIASCTCVKAQFQCTGPSYSTEVSCNESSTTTYSWDISAWSACINTGSSCIGTYNSKEKINRYGQPYNRSIGEFKSTNPYGLDCLEVSLTCNSSQSECSWDGTSSQYDAYGGDGGIGASGFDPSCIYPHEPFSAPAYKNNIQSCSIFTTDENLCNSNVGCSWQTSVQQVQTRTVVCRDNNGNQVSDSLCSQPKPATTQPCGTSNSCGGYSHVYVKELNYNQTNNWTAPGEVACSPSVWQFDRSRTSTYGFFSDSAGTIPINVNNLTINYSENGTYGSSSHSANITGGSYSLVSRHEESYDFPPAACAVYSEFNASITNNSCVTVITGSGVPGTCGSANEGSFPSAPSANLCSSGTTSAVSGTGPWSWQCLGTNGGATASCNATRSTTPVNAVCGTSHGQATSAFPTAGLCSVGTPFITSVSPDGSNFFTWTCLGSDGGANASCNAPYVAMACVPYAPLTTHAGLNTNIIPTNTNDVAVALNNTSFPNLTSTGGFMSGGVMRNTVIYTNSGSYSFTGAITSGQYLKVTINNLASAGQFVQFRETENQTTGPFYGCNASQWNVSDPLSWPYNVGLQNVGMLADAGDLGRGWIEALNNPIHQISAFVAWFKPGKGFEVRCEVCALSTPVTTRSSACENLPAHAIANTTSTIVQNYIAGSWSPSTIFTYNTTPSTSECRFVCETGYNRNGSACVQNATYSWDTGNWSICSNNQQTRTVVCKDNNGATVADSLCTQPKPNTSQAASCGNSSCPMGSTEQKIQYVAAQFKSCSSFIGNEGRRTYSTVFGTQRYTNAQNIDQAIQQIYGSSYNTLTNGFAALALEMRGFVPIPVQPMGSHIISAENSVELYGGAGWLLSLSGGMQNLNCPGNTNVVNTVNVQVDDEYNTIPVSTLVSDNNDLSHQFNNITPQGVYVAGPYNTCVPANNSIISFSSQSNGTACYPNYVSTVTINNPDGKNMIIEKKIDGVGLGGGRPSDGVRELVTNTNQTLYTFTVDPESHDLCNYTYNTKTTVYVTIDGQEKSNHIIQNIVNPKNVSGIPCAC